MTVGGLTGRLPALVAVMVAAAGCGLVGGDDVAGTRGGGSGLAALTAVQPVTVDGHRVATRCAGSKSDPTVLLVSGYDSPVTGVGRGAEAARVPPQGSAPTTGCGVGSSDAPPRRQTFADMADELDAVMSALGLRAAGVLVAQDLGGMVATTWAEAHDDDLAGLVLRGRHPPGYLDTALQLGPGALHRRGRRAVRADLERLLSPRDNAEHLAAGPALRRGHRVPGARCGAGRRADPQRQRLRRPAAAGGRRARLGVDRWPAAVGGAVVARVGCRPSTGPGTSSSGTSRAAWSTPSAR